MSDKTILLIEDDTDTQRGVALRLRACGYRVAISGDATTAISEARRWRPDLILLDLGLPGGSGLGLLEQFKTLGPTAGVPVIVISGKDAVINRPKALKAGAIAYFEKPADNEILLATIRRHLGDVAAEQSTRQPLIHARPMAMPEPTQQRKILIIEDDEDTRLGLSLRLRSYGFTTAYAADASTALTVAKREQPDVVLLDLGLPGGDGYVVLERLRTLPALAATPVIVVSARDAHIHRPRSAKAGAIAYLEKPIDNDLLLKAIKTALGS